MYAVGQKKKADYIHKCAVGTRECEDEFSTTQTSWGIFPEQTISNRDISAFTSRRSYLVPGRHPSSLRHQSASILINLRCGLHDLIHSSLLPRPRILNIAQSLLQLPQLHLHLSLCLLRILHRNLLEALDRLQLLVHVVCHGLEALVVLFDLVDHGLILEDGPIVPEVNGLGLLGEKLDFAASVVVALFESCKSAGGAAAEAEGGADRGPVELHGGAGLDGSVNWHPR